MSRSVKKGPFIQPVLLKRVQEMNASGEKKVLKTWSISSVTRLPSMTAASMFRYTLPRIWSDTSSANSPPPVPSGDTPVKKRHPASNGRSVRDMATRVKEKAAARQANADKRPRATAKFVRVAPRKAKIVVDLIRGKQVDDALAILMYTPKSAAPVVEKLLSSAIANAEYKEMDRSSLYVAEVYANQGPTLKRYWARSHGRADMIKKHTSHITIVLDQK